MGEVVDLRNYQEAKQLDIEELTKEFRDGIQNLLEEATARINSPPDTRYKYVLFEVPDPETNHISALFIFFMPQDSLWIHYYHGRQISERRREELLGARATLNADGSLGSAYHYDAKTKENNLATIESYDAATTADYYAYADKKLESYTREKKRGELGSLKFILEKLPDFQGASVKVGLRIDN